MRRADGEPSLKLSLRGIQRTPGCRSHLSEWIGNCCEIVLDAPILSMKRLSSPARNRSDHSNRHRSQNRHATQSNI